MTTAVPIITAITGVAGIAALVGYFGADGVIGSLLAIGWRGFSTICLIHLAVISVEGIAWRILVPGARLWIFLWGRLLRDASSKVLPISQMGGCVLGARVVALAGVSGTIAAASTMVDLTLEFIAKLAYMALGLILLAHLKPDAPVGLPVTIGLTATGLFAIAFVLAQRHGFELFDRFTRILGQGWEERTFAGATATYGACPHLSPEGRLVGRVRIAPRLLDRKRCRGLDRASSRRRPARLCRRSGDRELALRRPHARLCDPECRGRSGRGLCSDRGCSRADPGDGARRIALEARATW
jgi:hypothetical protein